MRARGASAATGRVSCGKDPGEDRIFGQGKWLALAGGFVRAGLIEPSR